MAAMTSNAAAGHAHPRKVGELGAQVDVPRRRERPRLSQRVRGKVEQKDVEPLLGEPDPVAALAIRLSRCGVEVFAQCATPSVHPAWCCTAWVSF